MSCAQRGIDSATAAVDLQAAGEGVPGGLMVNALTMARHRAAEDLAAAD